MCRQIFAGILLSLLLSFGTAATGAGVADKGSAIYEVLSRQGLLEDYMPEAVSEIAGTLIMAAQRWPGYGVNQPYLSGYVNIYMVNGDRLPEENVLEEFGVELARHSIQGNALAHEETGMLFVDTGLLKSLVTVALLSGEGEMPILTAIAAVKAHGVDAFRQLWDPEMNSALKNAEDTDKWAVLASGATAFVLAHEIGHIYLGVDDESRRRKPMLFKSKADEDNRWACEDLVDEKYRQQQRIEQEADDFAVSILSQVLFPEIPQLRYEIGANWYIIYSLSEQIVESLYATKSEYIQNSLQTEFGPEIYQKLVARRESSGRGSVHVFFPKSHPANIKRLSVSLERMGQSPYSADQGKPSSTDAYVAMLETLRAGECENLRAKYGR